MRLLQRQGTEVTISNMMAKSHKDCDALFMLAEGLAAGNEWPALEKAFEDFTGCMETHLGMEEEVLFPAFENATGMTQGPTMVMRMEHEQMRDLFGQLREALDNKNSDDFLGLAETLLILMQQHNAKEEQMLYPMMDDALAASATDLMNKFKERQSH